MHTCACEAQKSTMGPNNVNAFMVLMHLLKFIFFAVINFIITVVVG